MSTERSRLTPYAQKLRSNMTPEEVKLWTMLLHGLPVTVRRQKPIGPYIVDFYIASKKVVIELDGTQHFEGDGPRSDAARDAFLRSKGITVLRYPNSAIRQEFQAVCEDILQKIGLADA